MIVKKMISLLETILILYALVIQAVLVSVVLPVQGLTLDNAMTIINIGSISYTPVLAIIFLIIYKAIQTQEFNSYIHTNKYSDTLLIIQAILYITSGAFYITFNILDFCYLEAFIITLTWSIIGVLLIYQTPRLYFKKLAKKSLDYYTKNEVKEKEV